MGQDELKGGGVIRTGNEKGKGKKTWCRQALKDSHERMGKRGTTKTLLPGLPLGRRRGRRKSKKLKGISSSTRGKKRGFSKKRGETAARGTRPGDPKKDNIIGGSSS